MSPLDARMIRAIGYCSTPFEPADPGRLCRGRERWIDPWEAEPHEVAVPRLVLTGATFTDDAADDALRGLHHGGLEVANVLAALFPRKTFIAFMEDGHPADIPEDAVGVELYTGHRNGGTTEMLLVRWFKVVTGVGALRTLLGATDPTDHVRGLLVVDDAEALDEALMAATFALVGMSTLDSPPAAFQPTAIPGLLQSVRAVVLLHRDKHGAALGLYGTLPEDAETRVRNLADKAGALWVRFGIPPMLARWDRAIDELRGEWASAHPEIPFPVPANPNRRRWEPRHRRRRHGEREPHEGVEHRVGVGDAGARGHLEHLGRVERRRRLVQIVVEVASRGLVV